MSQWIRAEDGLPECVYPEPLVEGHDPDWIPGYFSESVLLLIDEEFFNKCFTGFHRTNYIVGYRYVNKNYNTDIFYPESSDVTEIPSRYVVKWMPIPSST